MSKIEWTGETWNPISGCSIVSPGCTNCYAMKQAARLEVMNPALAHYQGLTKKVNGRAVWTGKVALAPEATLLKPLRKRTPTTWFVNSMSDLFHEDVPDGWIMTILEIMFRTPQHTYQVLTKRSARMREFMLKWADLSGETFDPKLVRGPDATRKAHPSGRGQLFAAYLDTLLERSGGKMPDGAAWPTFDWAGGMIGWPRYPANVWLGVSAERQNEADQRIPDLLATPAAVRFVSAEPLLGPVDFNRLDVPGYGYLNALDDGYFADGREPRRRLDWIIVGGESGHGAREMKREWADDIVRQCKAAGVSVFVKQLGAAYSDEKNGVAGATIKVSAAIPIARRLRHRKGADMAEWPEGLRVREMPDPHYDERAIRAAALDPI